MEATKFELLIRAGDFAGMAEIVSGKKWKTRNSREERSAVHIQLKRENGIDLENAIQACNGPCYAALHNHIQLTQISPDPYNFNIGFYVDPEPIRNISGLFKFRNEMLRFVMDDLHWDGQIAVELMVPRGNTVRILTRYYTIAFPPLTPVIRSIDHVERRAIGLQLEYLEIFRKMAKWFDVHPHMAVLLTKHTQPLAVDLPGVDGFIGLMMQLVDAPEEMLLRNFDWVPGVVQETTNLEMGK